MALLKRHRIYRVEPRDEEWTGPEETLVDAGSGFADLESPVGEGMFRIGTIAMIIVLAALGVASVRLMVGDHERMAILSAVNRTVTVGVPPPRGLIVDYRGMHLVENIPSFDLLVVTRQIRRNGDGTFPGLQALADALGASAEELTLKLSEQMERNAVFFLATDIGKDAALSLTQGVPEGFYVITSTKRDYLDGEQFSAVLGYVGRVSTADMAADEYYLPSDSIGRAGIEASYEDVLRGAHGYLSFQAADQRQQVAAQGNSVVLNLDAQAQKKLFNIILGILNEAGTGEAAAIVQDPSSGAVLAMTSFPSYDNNVFSHQLSREQFAQLFESPRRPLFNRVVGGKYNPGSTIKPFIGMAALQDGVVEPGTSVPDCNAISIPNPSDPSDPYVFHNWRPEAGAFDLDRAIADSCNIYFFSVGGGHGAIEGLGIERIAAALRGAHADAALGIDLPGEESGFVPDPGWKWITRKEPWYQGDTYNISIGQGDLLLTPLWLNAYVGAVANGGTLWRPQMADRVVDRDGGTVRTVAPEEAGTLPFGANVIGRMRKAMEQTVLRGTAKVLRGLPVSAAAKTGTAEVIKGRKINSLFTVYAPAENPKIVMTVLIEGTPENQGYAIRAANQFLQWYFTRPVGAGPAPNDTPASASSGL